MASAESKDTPKLLSQQLASFISKIELVVLFGIAVTAAGSSMPAGCTVPYLRHFLSLMTVSFVALQLKTHRGVLHIFFVLLAHSQYHATRKIGFNKIQR